MIGINVDMLKARDLMGGGKAIKISLNNTLIGKEKNSNLNFSIFIFCLKQYNIFQFASYKSKYILELLHNTKVQSFAMMKLYFNLGLCFAIKLESKIKKQAQFSCLKVEVYKKHNFILVAFVLSFYFVVGYGANCDINPSGSNYGDCTMTSNITGYGSYGTITITEDNNLIIQANSGNLTIHSIINNANLNSEKFKLKTDNNYNINIGSIINTNGMGINISEVLGTITIGEITNLNTFNYQPLYCNGSSCVINRFNNYSSANVQFKGSALSATLGTFYLQFKDNTNTFNNFTFIGDITSSNDGNNMNYTHIAVTDGAKLYLDNKSKILLKLKEKVELNKNYALNKVILNYSDIDNVFNHLGLLYNDPYDSDYKLSSIYQLQRDGNYFKIVVDTRGTTPRITAIDNIRNLNHLLASSNTEIFGKKINRKTKILSKLQAQYNNYLAHNFRENELFYYSNADSAMMDFENTQLNEFNELSHVLHSKSIQSSKFTEPDSNLIDSNFAKSSPLTSIYLDSTLESTYLSDTMKYRQQERQRRSRINNSIDANKSANINSRLNSTSFYINSNRAESNDDFYFIFSPFVNHSILSDEVYIPMSGLNYGFVSAFNANLANIHTLGLHFGLNYGNMKGKQNLSYIDLNTLSLMAGIHYKIDFIYSMYVKARGDFFYFMNDMTSNVNSIKPSNIGFSASIYYGKDFNFIDYGVVGIELGGNYIGFKSGAIDIERIEHYNDIFASLLYLDLGISYAKVFNFGLVMNAAFGAKYNAMKENTSSLSVYNNKINSLGTQENYAFSVASDTYLAYAKLGIGYVLNETMEFNLSYLGSFGDKSINNGGFFSYKLWF